MGETTKIQWCHHTFNPWWGCEKVSAGCAHCYAEAWAKRTGHDVFGEGKAPRLFGWKHWAEPLLWNAKAAKAGQRRRVFCGSMCDVFQERIGIDDLTPDRTKLFELIGQTPALDWLLLTKRPENMIRLAPTAWTGGWPENVWALATVENQEVVAPRLDALLKVPARIRGLSMEPLLGSVDLGMRNWADMPRDDCRIDWIIVGGESGPKARICDVDAIRLVVEDCRLAGVPCFVKQLGSNPFLYDPEVGELVYIGPGSGGIKHPKGADPSEWPEDLRVQEFPKC
jgi:protein gp37